MNRQNILSHTTHKRMRFEELQTKYVKSEVTEKLISVTFLLDTDDSGSL